MTIRRRLTASFLVVLLLFGVNLVVFFWSNHKRRLTVEELQRASSRQLLLSSVREDLNDLQKQVNLLSQGFRSGRAAGPADSARSTPASNASAATSPRSTASPRPGPPAASPIVSPHESGAPDRLAASSTRTWASSSRRPSRCWSPGPSL